MNFFRFIADFLHLFSFILLILKVRQSKNVLGKYINLIYRNFIQDTRNIFSCIFDEILGFIFVFCFNVQFNNENIVYLFNHVYNLSLEI